MDKKPNNIGIINITEVNVPVRFTNSEPNKNKVKEVEDYYNKYGKLDKPIKVQNNYIIDGYVRYLIAKTNNLICVPCIFS